jgi:hypothetical protein
LGSVDVLDEGTTKGKVEGHAGINGIETPKAQNQRRHSRGHVSTLDWLDAKIIVN